MSAAETANGRGRMLLLAGSVAVSAVLFYAQTAGPPAQTPAATPAAAPAAAHDHEPPAAAAPVDSPTPAELLAASAPIASSATVFELSPGVAPEYRLQVNTIRAARAISALFPEIKTIGGYRQDPLKWHPNGLAIDVMIPDHNSKAGIELGNQIAGYALANAKRWGVIHVIWRQGFYPGVGAPSWTADYGSETLNHFDHIHIATNGGGYPTGDEKYFI